VTKKIVITQNKVRHSFEVFVHSTNKQTSEIARLITTANTYVNYYIYFSPIETIPSTEYRVTVQSNGNNVTLIM